MQFFMFLGAYVTGWVLCNVFFYQIIFRLRDNDADRMRWAKRMAEEYYKLVHPEPAKPLEEIE